MQYMHIYIITSLIVELRSIILNFQQPTLETASESETAWSLERVKKASLKSQNPQ